MPKLKHRFTVSVSNFGRQNDTIWFTSQVVTCGRPQIQFQNTALHSYNNVTYIAQKPEWQPIELTLRDDITNLATSLVSSQVQSQMNHYTQSAARAASDYKFTMTIASLDGSALQVPLEEWVLEGCYLEQVQYDSMDFASSDPTMITLSIRYDNATQGGEQAQAYLPLQKYATAT
jgi:uncharacterized protein YlxP (DUF503 family)